MQIFHELPFNKTKLLFVFFFISALTGIVYDAFFDTVADELIHDSAVVSKPRLSWENSAIIALDHNIPEYVSRKQALPLFALAVETALTAGAKFVFMDATIFESSPNMQYAQCINFENETVNWSSNTESFNPLSVISAPHIQQFSMPPTSPKVELFTLFNFDAALAIDESTFFSDVFIYHRSNNLFTPLARRFNLSEDSVATKIISAIAPKQSVDLNRHEASDVNCNESMNKQCRRIRFSKLHPEYNNTAPFPIIPLSEIVDCNKKLAPEIQATLKDRIVVIQLTTLDETTDVHMTPMSTSSINGTGELTLGSQIIVDSVETLLAIDQPQRPIQLIRVLLIMLCGLLTTLATAYCKVFFGFSSVLFNILVVTGFCFYFPIVQLWPVTAVSITSLVAFFLCLSAHLALGTQRGMMIAKYLPSQIRSMLLSSGKNKFLNKKTNAVVLISDLKGYTLATSLIKDPAIIFSLINEYLEETTIIIQETYHGWLENYVGDLVCFYWPSDDLDKLEEQKKLALQAAMVQSELQQSFFKNLHTKQNLDIDEATLTQISEFISAGIGVSTGTIAMGNIGPEAGVQKFGVLGDPLNLSSRIESLTRLFNTEIIITEELVDTARTLNYKVRKIANIVPKGKTNGCYIYALGRADDIRFSDKLIKQWEYFYYMLVDRKDVSATAPDIFRQDAETLKGWYDQGAYDAETKSWVLTQK